MPNPAIRLFCYGTLQLPAVLEAVIGRTLEGRAAWLPGYRPCRVRGAGYPGLRPAGGAVTPGRLYEGLTPREIAVLDRFEGALYTRQAVTVRSDEGRWQSAWCYLVAAQGLAALTDEPWRLEDFRRTGLAAFMAQFVEARRPVYHSAAAAGAAAPAPEEAPPDPLPGPQPPPLSQALARRPGANCTAGLTTSGTPPRGPAAIREQHAACLRALEAAGLEVTLLPAEEAHPDAYFVEDTAVVTPGLAVITRPGAPSRRGEEQTIAPVLQAFRPLARMKAPATLDGGDVIVAEDLVLVGLSSRTNRSGARQLEEFLAPQGYTVRTVPVEDGLHLKSSANYLGGGRMLLAAALARHPVFAPFETLVVPAEEHYACNSLAVNAQLLMPRGYPRTRQLLESLGRPLVELEMEAIRRMDGGLTCLSLRF